jgi:hypothetical protein
LDLNALAEDGKLRRVNGAPQTFYNKINSFLADAVDEKIVSECPFRLLQALQTDAASVANSSKSASEFGNRS